MRVASVSSCMYSTLDNAGVFVYICTMTNDTVIVCIYWKRAYC